MSEGALFPLVVFAGSLALAALAWIAILADAPFVVSLVAMAIVVAIAATSLIWFVLAVD